MKRFYSLYRISDAGRRKEKVNGASKLNCLKNYIDVFGRDGLIVFADNCSEKTVDEIRSLGIEPHIISKGNSGSFRHSLIFAIEHFEETDRVYMVEDDYWHLPGSKEVLIEGLEISDYVALYDCPDKYINFREGSPNPYIKERSEVSNVYLTKTCHWKTTNASTMTFACEVSVLKQDRNIFRKFTKHPIPNDFGIFLNLTGQPLLPLYRAGYRKLALKSFFIRSKKRRLISPIPGYSTHLDIDYLSPLTDWKMALNRVEENKIESKTKELTT